MIDNYSRIKIEPVDVAKGIYRITNRFNFATIGYEEDPRVDYPVGFEAFFDRIGSVNDDNTDFVEIKTC